MLLAKVADPLEYIQDSKLTIQRAMEFQIGSSTFYY